MTEAKINASIIHFEHQPCGRCGGSGKYSYNPRHGTVCYGCSGKGERLSVRGKAAFDALEKALAASAGCVALADIEPGMRIWSKASGGITSDGVPYDLPHAWRTVETVKVTHDIAPRGIKGGKRVDVVIIEADLTFTGGHNWRIESSDDDAFWAKQAHHTIHTERAVRLGTDEARAARDEVRTRIAATRVGAWLEGQEPPAPKTPKAPKPAETPAPAPAPAPKPLPANLYAGDCHKCGAHVEAKQGERLRLEDRWAVQHKSGECPASSPQEAPVAAGPTETPAPTAETAQEAPVNPAELSTEQAEALYDARYRRNGRFDTQDALYASDEVSAALLARGLAATEGTNTMLTQLGRRTAEAIEQQRAQEHKILADELKAVADRDRAQGVISDEQLGLWAQGRLGKGYRSSVDALSPLAPELRPAVMREARAFMNTTPGWNFSGAVWEAAKNVPAGRTPGGDLADTLIAYDPDGTKAEANAARGGSWKGFVNAAEAQGPQPAAKPAEAAQEAQEAPAVPVTVEWTGTYRGHHHGAMTFPGGAAYKVTYAPHGTQYTHLAHSAGTKGGPSVARAVGLTGLAERLARILGLDGTPTVTESGRERLTLR